MLDNLTIPLITGGILLVFVLVGVIYSRFYIKMPSNRVAVITGKKTRLVYGGSTIRKPVVERLDEMSLEPYKIPLQIRGIVSKEGVRVNVDGVALVRYGPDDEGIKTAVARWLDTEREVVQGHIKDVLSGGIRGVCAKMTVEEINSNREGLRTGVASDVEEDFRGIGMNLEVLTIEDISDEEGYLDALGKKRTAEVVSAAEIGEANAKRDSRIATAKANEDAATAEAQADAEIAKANKERDLTIAAMKEETDKANATAAQAGPLADAIAKRQVVKETQDTLAEEERGKTRVAEVAVERETKELEAKIIAQAEAEKTAAVLRADGEAEAVRRKAQADADARKAKAEAEREELVARADGEKARLLAEAEGKQKLADALNAYGDEALRLDILPLLIEKLPEIVGEASEPFGEIDNVVMIDGGSGDSSPMSRFATNVPIAVGTAMQVTKAMGLDIAELLGGAKGVVKESAEAASEAPENSLTTVAAESSEVDGSDSDL